MPAFAALQRFVLQHIYTLIENVTSLLLSLRFPSPELTSVANGNNNSIVQEDSHDSDPTLVFDSPLTDLAGFTFRFNNATPCHFRFLDCDAFLDRHQLRVVQLANDSLTELSYAAVSYPWRDLQMPEGKQPPEGSFSVEGADDADEISIDVLRTTCLASRSFGAPFLWLDRLCLMQANKDDKNWQIQRMYQIYIHCHTCLVLPGGLVRLAGLSEPTSWVDRAWTLQEAAANLRRETIKCVFSYPYASYGEFVEDLLVPNSGYSYGFSSFLRNTNNLVFAKHIIEPRHSAACDILDLTWNIEHGMVFFKNNDLILSRDYRNFPIRIIYSPAAELLRKSIVFDNNINYQLFWISAFVRSSSRPVDMVFSIMGPMGVNLDVSQYQTDDRVKATISLIQALLKRGRKAEWLFIAPNLAPSAEISLLPAFPETSVSGRALVKTSTGCIPAFEAIGLQEPWKSDGAPTGVLSDSGYFTFHSRGAMVSNNRSRQSCGSSDSVINSGGIEDGDVWAVIIGRRREHNRNPETGQISVHDDGKRFPVIVELTLMFIEKHEHNAEDGHELFHRIGMEHEIDEKVTSTWHWIEREFSVGGPGTGDRLRFTVSSGGPVYA